MCSCNRRQDIVKKLVGKLEWNGDIRFSGCYLFNWFHLFFIQLSFFFFQARKAADITNSKPVSLKAKKSPQKVCSLETCRVFMLKTTSDLFTQYESFWARKPLRVENKSVPYMIDMFDFILCIVSRDVPLVICWSSDIRLNDALF